jgi:hypothetical protein
MVGVDDVIAYVVLLMRRLTLELLDCLLPFWFGNGGSSLSRL